MNQQATIIDELSFTQPHGEQEKQILTADAVEFLTELVTRFTPKRAERGPAAGSSNRVSGSRSIE